MIPLSRRRPGSITAFAVLFFAAAVLSFLRGMIDLPAQQSSLETLFPAVTWSRDAVIVWLSAWLSIALIPIAMVWLSAVRFARWMVTLMALPKAWWLVTLVTGGPAVISTLGPLVPLAPLWTMIAVALLFTPASNRWFARKGEDDPAVFE